MNHDNGSSSPEYDWFGKAKIVGVMEFGNYASICAENNDS